MLSDLVAFDDIVRRFADFDDEDSGRQSVSFADRPSVPKLRPDI
jgi:hypothetical protein